MKKVINLAENVEEEMICGLVKAYPDTLRKMDDELVVLRAVPKQGKVALISGGGSGHEPAHAGYVGYGMLDAAVAGAVFTSPSVEPIVKAIQAVDTGAGVLMVVKNYTGDVMNFTMAGEQAKEENGIQVARVVVNDDVAVENSTWTTGRRGVAGTVFVHKIAGAKAETGAELAEVARVAQKVIDNVRTMGMAISPCTIPAAGVPGFTLAEDEAEFGIGIHGEPGVKRERFVSADASVDELMAHILADLDFDGHEVAVMVNGCGATPLMELYIVNNRVAEILKQHNITAYKTFVGNYMTSIEMAGFSITLLRLDDELKPLLDATAATPGFPCSGPEKAEEPAAVRPVKTEAHAVGKAAAEEAAATGAGDDPKTRILVRRAMENIIADIEENRQYLTELDIAIGDGDHGINMSRGFQAVVKNRESLYSMTAAQLLDFAGKTLMRTVGGSSGPLYGSAFKVCGKVLSENGTLNTDVFLKMLDASVAVIQKLGKAEQGEKTMLDAMIPALQTMQAYAGHGTKAMLHKGVEAAAAGAEYTKTIIATKGRASYLGERSLGHKDPGAESFTVILRAIEKSVNGY